MGYTTDFIGHINIKPRLNQAEQLYLMAFADSRRFARPGGPYEVPQNPAAEHGDHRVADVDTYSSTAPGQPSLWCGWRPCWEGCCLAHDGIEKFYAGTEWLAYLIDHFLAPHAYAAQSGLECFTEFTFDHVLDGTIAACSRDTRRLYLIRVDTNVVTEQTLVAGASEWPWEEPLPYEKQIDETTARRQRRTAAG